MPVSETPGYNSLRVQKAYRINGIESGRLEKKLQILERQKLHSMRLVNNNIRLTRIALEHIEANSGKSIDQPGFDGNNSPKTDFEAFESGEKPMFLYGERQVSRRAGKFRRIQSAFAKGRSHLSTTDDDLLEEMKRPSTSIPTFSEIRERVQRQLEINPSWDPNKELPNKDPETVPRDVVIHNNWVYDSKPNTPAVNKRENTDIKAIKKITVSWKKPSTSPEIQSLTDSDSSSRTGDKAEDNKKLAEDVTLKRKDPSYYKEEKSNEPSKAEEHESNGEHESEQKDQVVQSLRSVIYPGQKRSPRDHPMSKVVSNARELIGKAKKAQNSAVYNDPESKVLGSNLLRQKKKQEARLARNKVTQQAENISTNSKVLDYLNKHPPPEIQEINDPNEQYIFIKEILKLKSNGSMFLTEQEDQNRT